MKESEIINAIRQKLGIESLNPMQKKMAESTNSNDVILLSPTGSGKTIAFTIPMLKNLRASNGRVQAIVIAPSRELTIQIAKVVQAIASEVKVTCCYGGHNFEDEKNSLSVVPDIIVSTPGRLLDHINRGNVDVYPTRILVLDEFDKSLELGFHDELSKILREMPNVSRRILTSATALDEFPDFLRMKNAETISFLHADQPAKRMKIYEVKSDLKDKLDCLLTLLKNLDNGRTIVFANHRESAERIFDFLRNNRQPAGIYHGGLDQIEREKAISMFNNGTFMILVTTDLGSRGLDIQEVKHIIHYHLPLSEETYTHRNGRTARVDANGSIYVITGPEERLPEYIQFDEELQIKKESTGKIRSFFETLFFSAGKKEKISRGDILGFLTAKGELEGAEIGKIDIADHYALVAVPRDKAKTVLAKISKEKIKNKRVKISIARQ